MKLIELIERGVDYDDILYHDGGALGMRKCKDLGDAFVYCYPETGKFVEEHISRTGYRRVVLCEKILADDKWNKRTLIKPKYKIGDRFVMKTIQGSQISWGGVIWDSVYNAVVTIADIKYDDQYIYTLTYTDYFGKKGTLTKEISEEELATYDMVVSQDN